MDAFAIAVAQVRHLGGGGVGSSQWEIVFGEDLAGGIYPILIFLARGGEEGEWRIRFHSSRN